MAVTAVKVWVANEILFAADLVAEFANVYGNGQQIGFPRTSNADFNGYTLILDADTDTTLRASTDDQIDIAIGGTDTYRMTATQMTILGRRVLTVDDLMKIGISSIRSTVYSNQNRITQLENDHILAAQSFSF